jgi:predicted TIM-barrel enzyme
MPRTPIFLPGYTNHDNAARRLADVDGAFVGTCLEKDGWGSAVDVERVRAYMEIVKGLA